MHDHLFCNCSWRFTDWGWRRQFCQSLFVGNQSVSFPEGRGMSHNPHSMGPGNSSSKHSARSAGKQGWCPSHLVIPPQILINYRPPIIWQPKKLIMSTKCAGPLPFIAVPFPFIAVPFIVGPSLLVGLEQPPPNGIGIPYFTSPWSWTSSSQTLKIILGHETVRLV